jgi:hypothetical protein
MGMAAAIPTKITATLVTKGTKNIADFCEAMKKEMRIERLLRFNVVGLEGKCKACQGICDENGVRAIGNESMRAKKMMKQRK